MERTVKLLVAGSLAIACLLIAGIFAYSGTYGLNNVFLRGETMIWVAARPDDGRISASMRLALGAQPPDPTAGTIGWQKLVACVSCSSACQYFRHLREGERREQGPVEGASYRIAEAEGDTGHYDNTLEFVVPPGHLFVLGDNRDNSVDSRDQSGFGVGFVPVELVIGRVIATF